MTYIFNECFRTFISLIKRIKFNLRGFVSNKKIPIAKKRTAISDFIDESYFL